MVAHEDVDEDIQPKSLRALAEPVEKALLVVLIAKDRPPLIAAIENVVECTRLVNA